MTQKIALFWPGDYREYPNEAALQIVVELIGYADRDMRGLGLQQVREGIPGESATKRFAELLPGLPPDGQAGLLEALGDRGDAAARPGVLQMLDSKEEAVRAAALLALGSLGTASKTRPSSFQWIRSVEE